MARRFEGGRLIVASHNPGKVAEIQDLLAPYRVDCVAAGTLGLAEPEETGASFTENAELKAVAAAEAGRLPALADDSGLVVEALGGAPGIYSARWAGPERDFALAMAEVERRLQAAGATGAQGRRAAFVSVLTLAWPDGHRESFEGRVAGCLVWPPRGERGFGYDPVFQADGLDVTFGELAPEEKHRISHRAVAFRRLIDACFRS
ncbi:MAG: RdgB/HAM1 family non-canonical purine NTP pyrophosphatase [Alphaproteobacteria bacterium]|jgi:XTP/dITP diphosphohydrolase|nr:RdgB/HAM1 family non-canonical purine NTP pyrophosphatase [Alphaproteobacteria bacterium]